MEQQRLVCFANYGGSSETFDSGFGKHNVNSDECRNAKAVNCDCVKTSDGTCSFASGKTGRCSNHSINTFDCETDGDKYNTRSEQANDGRLFEREFINSGGCKASNTGDCVDNTERQQTSHSSCKSGYPGCETGGDDADYSGSEQHGKNTGDNADSGNDPDELKFDCEYRCEANFDWEADSGSSVLCDTIICAAETRDADDSCAVAAADYADECLPCHQAGSEAG